jgi:hypothetical protein
MTRDDVAQFAAGSSPDGEACRSVRPATVSGNRWSDEKTCKDGRTISAEFVAETPERVKGKVVATGPSGKVTTVELGGRWLQASCAGIQ